MSVDPRLRIRHLTAFLAIARTGSVAMASSELNITQPAVSKTLKELEQILGVSLFDRKGRRLHLNSAGAMFQRIGGGALSELERAQSMARAVQAKRVKLRVGALPTAATSLLPQAALRFHDLYPDCTLSISTGPNWLLLSQLREGSLDMVVGRMANPDLMEGLTFRQLFLEPVVAAVRTGHPLLSAPDQLVLRDYPLILPPGGAVIHQVVRSYLLSVGAGELHPMFESVSLAFSLEVLLNSDAVWFISNGVVAKDVERGLLRTLPLDAPLLAGPVGVSQRADTKAMVEMETLIRICEELQE